MIAATSSRWREVALVIVPLALLAGVMMLDPITQGARYHDFADRREFLGVPNWLDVASNVAFLVVGGAGIAWCAERRRSRCASWMVFFFATLLASLGSVYYHWAPDDARLVWDRIPIALAAMSLFVAIASEHVDERLERFLLAPALALGLASVLWWRWSGDLRLYAWVQFAPLVCIPLAIAMFPARHTHRRFILYSIGLYILAKGAEMEDRTLFALTGGVVSGHTLKHLLAAGAIFALLLMLRRREAIHA